MKNAFLKPAMLMLAALACGCLQASTLDDIRALEAGKNGGTAPAMDRLSRSPAPERQTSVGAPQELPPVWYALSDGQKVNLKDWKVVLFMQSGCAYCHQFDPVLKAFAARTGLSVFPVSLDGKGDASYPDVLPATPDVMVEYFQSGMPIATPTTFLTNVNTMETWPLLQGAVDEAAFRSRLDDVLRMAIAHQSANTPPSAQQGH